MPKGLQSNHAPGSTASTGGLFQEQMLSLAQAARRLPALRGGKSPHPNTLFRWATAGRKSRAGVIVRLEICLVDGTNCTSIEALSRFFRRLNDAEMVRASCKFAAGDESLESQAEAAKDILRSRGLI